MASNFPKLPGYVPTHDPTMVDHKKVSHIKLEQIRNARNVIVPLHALPRQVDKNFLPEKTDMSKSLSHMQYPNHNGKEINELFEPTFVKLDKQVSKTQRAANRYSQRTRVPNLIQKGSAIFRHVTFYLNQPLKFYLLYIRS